MSFIFIYGWIGDEELFGVIEYFIIKFCWIILYCGFGECGLVVKINVDFVIKIICEIIGD